MSNAYKNAIEYISAHNFNEKEEWKHKTFFGVDGENEKNQRRLNRKRKLGTLAHNTQSTRASIYI